MLLKSTQPFELSNGKPYDDSLSDNMYLYAEGTYLLKRCYRYILQRHSLPRRVFRYGLMLMILLLFSILLKAADFPVTNTNDSGPGSMRQAILDANASSGANHRIRFSVYGTIVLSSSLPQINSTGLVIDGENKITLNTNGGDVGITFFTIAADEVQVKNFTFLKTGSTYFYLPSNTTGVLIDNIVAHNTENWVNSFIWVAGASMDLTIRKVTFLAGMQACGGDPTGRAFAFTNGMQTNLVMDSIMLGSANNSVGCEAVLFRNASVNGWTFTNSNISGFQNFVVLDNTGGPVETANNVLLRNVTLDSTYSGVALGIYSDFVNTDIQLKNVNVDLNVVTSTDDGDYSIRFDNTTNGVILDTVTSKDADLYSIWFNGAAQNVTINHTKVSDPTPGDGFTGQFIRFEGAANNITIKNTILDADKLNTTDDADYGLLFVGATNGVTLDSLTVNEFDGDGCYIVAANTNFQLSNSRFTKNFDGIEFYYSLPRTNVDIVNSSFSGSTRSGIVVNAGNATSDIDLTGDTVFNNTNHGIWLYGGTSPTDVTISGCVIHDNGGAGINNDDPDKVIYTNNSIYNNTGLGIDNISGNCGYQGANRPVLVSSTPLGGGQYQLVINLPALVASGYTVDIYANDPATSPSSGQYFVTSLTGLNSGSNSRTFTYNTGPGASGVGFWTATLRIPANNCGTSEFSDKLNIGSKAPACITNGILAWYRADMGVNGNIWGDISGNGNNTTFIGDPDDTTGLVNFNKAFYYDGNDAHRVPASAGVSTAYTIMGLARLEGTQTGRVFSSSTGNKLLGWHGGLENRFFNEAWYSAGNAITNYTKLYSVKRSNTGGGPYEFKGNGVLLNAGAASNSGVWTLDIGSTSFSEYSKVFVPEVFIYNRDLTPAEIQRLESYMGLKYGITLNNGNTDYVASDGTTLMWSSSANTGYAKRITGIGRDECTMLDQKQSLSADTGTVTIALGNTIALSNAANASTFTTDKTFLVFGDNNGSVAYATAVAGANANMRMARVFKVQKSAAWGNQDITLKVKGAGQNNYLLISTDPTFATITQELQLDANGAVTLNSSLLANGAYFTVGAKIAGPNNVTAGIAMWLRADDGNATGAQWNDFSGNSNGAEQATATRQPVVNASGINFNPILKFNGTNNFMAAPSLMTANGTANLAVFAVTTTDVVQSSSIISEYMSPAGTYSSFVNIHLPWSDNLLYWDAPSVNRTTVAWGGVATQPYLWSFTRSTTNKSIFRNAGTLSNVNGTFANVAGFNRQFTIGAYSDGTAGYFNGKIAELIVYNNAATMTATDRQKVQSYLAIKYGITIDQTVATNYLASDAAVYWNATANSAYSRHITGIGRDSITALNQKQSLSVDSGYVTVALGSSIPANNAANSGTITNDKSFFVFGDNGAAKTFNNTVTGLTNVNVTLARVFRVQKTNWADQNITLRTDSTLPAPDYLVISTDAAFGAGDLAIPVTNRTVTLNTSQLPDGAYFTFGNTLKAPGNVITGIAAWWRADVDASAATWSDYSGNGKTLTQPTATAQPSVLPVNINYQPTVKFHNRAYYTSASLFGTASTDNVAIFAVSAADGAGANNAGSGLFSEFVSNGGQISAWAPYGNGHIYWYPPNGWSVVSTTPLVVYANPRYNVLGFTKTPAQLNIYFNHTTVGTANGTYTGINGNNQPFHLGAFNGPDWFNGRIAEFVVYNNSAAMTAADRMKIQSYLALKYGLTLSPAAPVNYLASDGTTNMWTAADNTGYGRRITGIGRDSSSALYQKQSISVDTGTVAIAAGGALATSNSANTSTITNDRSFFTFSDDGAATGFVVPVSDIDGVNNRMTRIFKVDKTNWADQVITLKLNGGNAQTYLLVSADAIFGAGDAAYVLNADSTVTLNSSNLPDGAYFTFATFIKGPNAITKGLNFWLRADDGQTTGSSWTDYAGYGHKALQPVVGGQPVTDARGINFNYSLKFDGTTDFLDINTTRVHPDSSTIFVAGSGSNFAAVRDMVSSGAVGASNGMEFRLTGPTALNYLENNGVTVTGVGGVSTFVDNRPYIFGATQSNVANGVKLHQNFRTDNQGTVALSPATANLVSIGSRTIASRAFYWLGNISEVIVYDRVLTDAERQSVSSYLGLKYGITLNNGETSYLATDNTIYWTADATYKSRVTGIGRDDSTTLNTKQSVSADTGFVTLALGAGLPMTNELNTGVITNDISFLVFADNGLSASNFTEALSGSAHNVTRRMARVWKVQKTNWADQNITFKITPIGIENHMFISSDPTFATFSQEIPVAADGTITFSSGLFTGSDLYFTFGAPLKSPGGVSGHALWVRADIGTSSTNNTALDTWSDMSALANSATQTTPASQPIFMNNGIDNINFNPVVKFNGSSHFMNLNIAKLPMGTTGRTVIGVGALNNLATTNKYIISWGTAALNQGMGLAIGDPPNGRAYFVGYTNDVYTNQGFWQANRVNEMTGTWAGAGGAAQLYSKMLNIGAVGAGNKAWNTTGTLARIGTSVWGAEYWSGPVGDLIVYPNELNASERLRVSSYLSLKYGYSIDQTTANNYLATDGSVIWDATANSTYKNNIAGIGRDDEEALTQKQSASANTGTQVVIGLGSIDSTNLANPNSFTADKSYLIWGDDNGALSFRTAVTGATLVNYRMGRIWKVQETGTVGNVMVAIPSNALANASSSYILVSNDASFDGTDVITKLEPLTINGKAYHGVALDLTNGQYFTFANDLKIPGGVVGNTLWLRADFGTSSTTDGTAISDWNDFGADINNATQATAANQPTYINNANTNINFNPVIRFNGTSQRMIMDGTKLPTGTIARTVIAATANAATAGRGLISWGDQNAAGLGTRYAMELGGGQRSIEVSNSRYGNVGGNTIIPGITMFSNAAGTTSAATQIRVNGAGVVNAGICCGTQTLNTLSLPTAYLGDNVLSGGGTYYNGLLGDVIVYDKTLTATEQLQVESYLALKYGVTMSQTVATDYLATDASVVWNATANAVYKNGITGIGRDDLEGLNQKQSRNSDSTRLRIALGLGALAETNIDNANTFSADKSYLIWGDDNAAATFKTVVTGNTNVNYRMTRLWTVQETGTVGTVEVAFPFDALPNPRQSYLVVSTDATIDNSDTYIPLYDITINGKKHWAAKTDFTTGQYFTVAAFIKSPGGVGATSLWVRADQGIQDNTDGAAVETWVDFGNEVNNASQSNTTLQPLFKNNATENINYNPVVVFNGTSQYMNLDVTRLPLGTTARSVIGTGALNNITGNRYMMSWGANAASQGMGLANVGGSGYFVGWGNDLTSAAGFWQLNALNEMFGTWAGAGGTANLYSKIQAVATPAAKAWNTGATGARIGNSVWGAEYWSGPITDLIVFDRELNNTERQRVSTYLAIRNGYTINQATPYSSYLNTAGTVIWDATANTAYGNNIAGIGRDDIEGLNQKQSKSIQTGAILAIGLGGIEADNASNSRTFVNDTSYLIWGSNSTAITTTTTDMPGRFNRRLTQEWKVSLSNFDNQLQPVTMEFNLTGVSHAATTAADFTLLIDTDGDGDFMTGTPQQVTATNYDSGTGLVTFDNITNLTSGQVFTLAMGPQTLKLTTKVILQGAWNGTAMTTGLKTVLPASDPYGQSTTPSVSPSATAAQVVDWIMVELRDTLNPATVVAARAGFVLANGNVVDTNYTQPLTFTGIENGHYKVAVRHRNHLGIMTLNSVDFSNGLATIDFTTNTTPTWGTNAQKSLAGGVMGMWAGNVNGDNLITHSAKPSDATVISNAVLTHAGNTSASPAYTGFSNVYHIADVNLDGSVRYTATPSDQTIITNNVKTHPANTFGLASFIIKQQLP